MTKQAWNKEMLGILGLSLCVLASGCGNSTSSSGSSSAESTSAQGAATATASEATAIAGSMTEAQVTYDGGANTGGSASPQVERPVRDSLASSCASIDVKSTGTSGQWTDEVLTFANPPCSYTGPRGFDTLALTGTLELTRADGDGYNFGSTATNLEWTFTNPNATYTETRNGTRQVTASATGASVNNNITVAYAGAQYSGTLVHQLSANFTPVAGSSLAKGEPLPSGTFTYTGNLQWTGSGGADDTFSVTTVVPLAYDATCKSTEPSVFDSGELHFHLSTDTGSAYAKVVWSDCGAPAVSFVAD
jgi:hypothetical protein